MNWSEIATVVLGALGLIGGIFTVLRLIYKRGGDERSWVTAIEENTSAVKDLNVSFRDFKDTTVAAMHQQAIDHEKLVARVGVIETKLRGR